MEGVVLLGICQVVGLFMDHSHGLVTLKNAPTIFIKYVNGQSING